MAQITGVPVSTPAVFTLYNTLQQSLPPTNDITAFVPSGQTAISQLADLYCNTAVNTASIQAKTFPGLDLKQSAATYFGATTPAAGSAQATNRALVINPLINAAIGSSVNPGDVNPAEATLVTTELNNLMNTLVGVSGTTTAQVAQGACSAVLGSAVVSLQ
jgi:hypothetical protein